MYLPQILSEPTTQIARMCAFGSATYLLTYDLIGHRIVWWGPMWSGYEELETKTCEPTDSMTEILSRIENFANYHLGAMYEERPMHSFRDIEKAVGWGAQQFRIAIHPNRTYIATDENGEARQYRARNGKTITAEFYGTTNNSKHGLQVNFYERYEERNYYIGFEDAVICSLPIRFRD